MLFGIDLSLGCTSSRWLDRLLFLEALRSDLTVGSTTIFTYATAFTLPWLDLGDFAGADRGVAAAALAAGGVVSGGFLEASLGVEDLKTFLSLEAPVALTPECCAFSESLSRCTSGSGRRRSGSGRVAISSFAN